MLIILPIQNYYGDLKIFSRDDKFYIGLDDHDDTEDIEEIPESLYKALAKWNKNLSKIKEQE